MMENLSRRGFLKAVCAGSLGLTMGPLAPAPVSAAAQKKEKLNFVFILVDDLGWSDIGCYGNRFNETPNIDALAAQGMRFTDAYAACPVCSPTRASILSGQYPARLGLTDFIPGHQRPYEKLAVPRNRQQYMPLKIVTIAEALKKAGYTCGAFGKWHLGGREQFPDMQGFDETLVTSGGGHFANKSVPDIKLGKDDYLSEVLTDQGEKFMEQNKDKPFFLYLSHFAVHIPLQARKELIEKYEKKPKPPTGVNNPIYAAMIEHVDQSVGRVLKKLDELKLAERTVVVFFSDNGGLRQHYKKIGPIATTNAPLRDEKGTLYEGGIREPLIVRWPGVVKPQTTCDVPVTSVDFYPTFLDIAQTRGSWTHTLDGESIVRLLKQEGKLKRDAIYWHYPHYHHSTPAGAIRQGDWKLIEFYEDGRVELYNLKEDISEKNDLAEKMPKLASRLKRSLTAWRKSVKADMPRPNPDYDPARAHEWGRPKW